MNLPNNLINKWSLAIGLALGMSIQTFTVQASIVNLEATFEDLTPTQAYAGPGGGFFENGMNLSGQYTSGGITFLNSFTDFGGGCCGSGFYYSNTTDTTTAGFTNQYSAFPGSGQGGSSNYGVAFSDISRIEFGGPAKVLGGYFANTTYSVLSMLNGDAFAKQFGGVSGNDPDFFGFTITGEDASGASTGSIDYYLADYRFANNSLDYIVSEWTFVSLLSLGEVSALTFEFFSSDVGAFGINTPTYFAIDNLRADVSVVPLPAGVWLLGSALIGLLTFRRREILT